MYEEQEAQTATPLEDRIRLLDWSDSPDWLHMKAIHYSRVLDECADQDTTNYFLLTTLLSQERRIRGLESGIRTVVDMVNERKK